MKQLTHTKALLLAVLVNIIWSTSWIFIKFGLAEIPAMTFAGLRYFLAALILLPFLFKRKYLQQIRKLTLRNWISLGMLGITLYFFGQSGQYFGLSYLPSVTVMLILNLNALFVALFSEYLLKEKLNWLQWLGVLLNLAGLLVYFSPINQGHGLWIGWFFSFVCLIGNMVGTILGRKMNRDASIHPIVITGISMLIGSSLMLVSGIAWQGIPALTTKSILIIILLAVINTALSFSLWNYTQQILTATESSIIGNTMLIYVSILAWIFLGEKQSALGIFGLALSLIGVIVVQLKLKNKQSPYK